MGKTHCPPPSGLRIAITENKKNGKKRYNQQSRVTAKIHYIKVYNKKLLWKYTDFKNGDFIKALTKNSRHLVYLRHLFGLTMTLHIFTISITLLLLVYHQATTLLPLFPWNDVENTAGKSSCSKRAPTVCWWEQARCAWLWAIAAFFTGTHSFITPSCSAANFFNGGCLIYRKSLRGQKPILIMMHFFRARQNWSRIHPENEHRMQTTSCCIWWR